MRKAGKVFVWLAVILVGVIVLYKLIYPTVTYRYRMTVDVEVDGKIHSGSSVIQVRLVSQPQILPEMGIVRQEISGQAVYVDLGEGRSVIALLTSGPYARTYDYPAYVVPAHFDLSYKWRDLIKYPFLKGHWQITPADLPAQDRPVFVTFSNLNDPNTAQILQPDAFSEVFGPGIDKPTITFAMTNDPVTRGILERLQWLRTFHGVTVQRVQFPSGWQRGKVRLTGIMFVRGEAR